MVGRVHAADYVEFVSELSSKVEQSDQPIPYTPRVQTMFNNAQWPGGNEVKDGLESDTFFSKGSMNAALRAVRRVWGLGSGGWTRFVRQIA